MKMFSKRKVPEDRILVVDVGSGSVGAALVALNTDAVLGRTTPRMLFSVRTEIKSETTYDFTKYLNAMVVALEESIQKVHDARFAPPHRVVGVLAAPWYAAQTRTIHYQKSTQFTFTHKLWYELLMREAKLFEESADATFGMFEGGLRLIERNNMEVKLNGYPAPSPFNKKTREVEMEVYMSMVPEYLVHTLEEVISKYFARPITWSTYLFTSYAVVRDLFVGETNYLLVDVGGEVTDVGLVKNGVLVESLSFPRGRNTLIRRIVEHLAVGWDEAESLLALYHDNMLAERHKKALTTVVGRVMDEWSHTLEHALATLTHDFALPETIFITVDEDVRALYEYATHKEGYTQFTLTNRRFNVIVVDASALHEYCALEQGATRDQFLMIDAMYATRKKLSHK
jgi:hypothetical protein